MSNDEEIDAIARKHAIRWVCPNTLMSETDYERREVANMQSLLTAALKDAIAQAKLANKSGGAEAVAGANVDALVNRFLGWRLPKNFAPDGGITFTPSSHSDIWPIGTNLLNADQAREMFEFLLAGMGKPVAWGIKPTGSEEIGEVLLGAYPQDIYAGHIVPLYTHPVADQPPGLDAHPSVAGMPCETKALIKELYDLASRFCVPSGDMQRRVVRAIGGA